MGFRLKIIIKIMYSLKITARTASIALLAFLAGLSMVILASQVEARISSPRGDEIVESSDAVDNVLAHLLLAAETTATSTLLADLSDYTNFPHEPGTQIEVSKIIVNWSTNVVATTTAKFGVVASSTPAGDLVDVYWFDEVSFTSSSLAGATDQPGRQQAVLDYSPGAVKLNLSSGLPASFLSNDSSTLTGDFATTSPLISPNGYTAPGVGDLVMRIYSQEGTATTSATAVYRVR